jgi:hypothetical protein
MSYRPPPLACALMMMMMASPSLCPDRAPLVHHLPSSPSVMGGIQSLGCRIQQNREIERERKQHTNLLPSTHWLFSFLVSVERQISCARRPAARWWKGAKGLLIIITRQSNNNGEDFVFSFNSHIFKREKRKTKVSGLSNDYSACGWHPRRVPSIHLCVTTHS